MHAGTRKISTIAPRIDSSPVDCAKEIRFVRRLRFALSITRPVTTEWKRSGAIRRNNARVVCAINAHRCLLRESDSDLGSTTSIDSTRSNNRLSSRDGRRRADEVIKRVLLMAESQLRVAYISRGPTMACSSGRNQLPEQHISRRSCRVLANGQEAHLFTDIE